MNETRVQELMDSMIAFRRETYQREELLDELLELQSEIINLTFNGEHAATADLKIYDVMNHLEQLNNECGNIADEEFQKFKNESYEFVNLIRKEISGRRGEAKAFKALDSICSEDNIIIKNVELEDEDFRTELDAVVISPNAVTIVEVKNTGKDIYIDQEGRYYKAEVPDRMEFDLAEKMYMKEALLRKALSAAGIKDVKIQRILVFTNNSINVKNECEEIYSCFVGRLPYVINKREKWQSIPEYKMHNIKRAIKAAECTNSYPVDFDIEGYKRDFATVMAILENAEVVETENNIEVEMNTKIDKNSMDKISKTRNIAYISGAVACLLLGGIAGLFVNTKRH